MKNGLIFALLFMIISLSAGCEVEDSDDSYLEPTENPCDSAQCKGTDTNGSITCYNNGTLKCLYDLNSTTLKLYSYICSGSKFKLDEQCQWGCDESTGRCKSNP
ncbi:MAG TPA: hypothetical protein PKG52_11880 [bacterium]|nr:hypothetical protein [bacterium]